MEQMEASVQTRQAVDTDSRPNQPAENKKHMRISVYAVPSSLVKNYYNFAKAVHLDIISFDYSGNSSYQMVKRQASRGTNVFIQLNEQDTLISILRDDTLILQRNVNYGVSMLIDAMLEQDYFRMNSRAEALELLSKNNLLIRNPEKKEKIFQDFSINQEETAAASELIRAAEESQRLIEQREQEAKRGILDSLHFLTNSVARMLDYYKANHKNEEINQIYLSGMGVRIQGIDQFFYAEIGIQHKKLDKLWTVSAKKKATLYRQNPSEFVACIGAVIDPIDFVPREFLERRQKRSAVIATAFVSLICLAGSAGIIYTAYSDYQLAQSQLAEVNNQLEAMPEVSSVYQENEQAQSNLESLQEFDAATESNNDMINSVISELEDKLPTGSKINTMQFSETEVSMSITAVIPNAGANALIAKLYTELEKITYFSKVDISDDISVDEEAIPSTASFTITCTYAQ
jgi:type IV pilus assembly protein PilM